MPDCFIGARRMIARLSLGALAVLAVCLPAAAAWPERPVKIVVPFVPGGANDLIARIVGAQLAQALGQPVVIENRGGANGNIGIAAVARAEPDGHTLLLTSNVFDVNPALSKQPSYDPIKDFAAIADIASAPNALVTGPNSGLKTFADVAQRARANPDELNFSTPGAGSISHLGAELMKIRAGIRMVHVPFAGAGPAIQAAMAGTVHLAGVTVATAVPQVKGGTAIALIQTGKTRWPDLPDIPTIGEAGIPDAESETGFAFYAPAATPKEIVERLGRETVAILQRADVQEQIQKSSFRVVGMGPQAAQARLAREVATWREVITKAGIKVD
jgi:tripartite-type tricarboxylate transporter receptor subunit TctC